MDFYEEQQKRAQEEAENAFKPITENPIILDFSGCKAPWQAHAILKEKFGLPEYYGANWDALWDCLDGLFEDDGPIRVEIRGYQSMPAAMRQYFVAMLEVFDDVHEKTPNVVFEFIS